MWEKLDASTDENLYVQTGVLWMQRGDDAYVRTAVAHLEELGFPIERIAIADATRRYRQIRFEGVVTVWLERRAGALFARRACGVVRDSFVEGGGKYQIGEVRPGAIAKGEMNAIHLADGSKLEADAYVFACGPWLGRLFPDVIGDSIRPSRQEVLYFGTPPGSTRYLPSELPTWIDFGEQVVYGIPDVDGRGLKVADDTRGEPFDPTSGERTVSKQAVDRARRFLAERFPELADAPVQKAEICQYENSPDGHLIIDRHPAAKNVWLVGGGSGHGFKLSPAVGEIAADAILKGKETPKMFRLDRFDKLEKPATQFERGQK